MKFLECEIRGCTWMLLIIASVFWADAVSAQPMEEKWVLGGDGPLSLRDSVITEFDASTVSAQQITGRWPLENDGPPSQRNSPIAWISHQKEDDRHRSWSWTRVENTQIWHWQHDVKIEDDDLSWAIHGNTDNHRLQIGEPAVYKIPGGYRLEFFIKHDRKGDNPIMEFVVYIHNGSVSEVEARNIRGAGTFTSFPLSLMKYGLNAGVDSALSWATGGVATAFGQTWRILDLVLPEDWLHQYRGWPKDAMWFAIQVGYLYARALPVE